MQKRVAKKQVSLDEAAAEAAAAIAAIDLTKNEKVPLLQIHFCCVVSMPSSIHMSKCCCLCCQLDIGLHQSSNARALLKRTFEGKQGVAGWLN